MAHHKSAKKRIKNDKLQLEVQMTRLGSKILELHKVSKAYGDLKILDQFTYTFKTRPTDFAFQTSKILSISLSHKTIIAQC